MTRIIFSGLLLLLSGFALAQEKFHLVPVEGQGSQYSLRKVYESEDYFHLAFMKSVTSQVVRVEERRGPERPRFSPLKCFGTSLVTFGVLPVLDGVSWLFQGGSQPTVCFPPAYTVQPYFHYDHQGTDAMVNYRVPGSPDSLCLTNQKGDYLSYTRQGGGIVTVRKDITILQKEAIRWKASCSGA